MVLLLDRILGDLVSLPILDSINLWRSQWGVQTMTGTADMLLFKYATSPTGTRHTLTVNYFM